MESNYWHGNWCLEMPSTPAILILFGASGDLSHRKLFPSLFILHRRGLLHERTRIIGCARAELSDDAFRAQVREALPDHQPDQIDGFLARLSYLAGDYLQNELYDTLKARLAEDDSAGTPVPPNHLFYLATPASVYLEVTAHLGESGLLDESGHPTAWRHVVLEKPFGYDYDSAEALDAHLHTYMRESQIYRIDHYLGKETVQNIAMLRFSNLIFEPVWNSLYIDHVQISVAETVGVEHRAGYYEKAGALRDMFQNHMLEMLSLAAMEMPTRFDADAVRDEKLKLIRAIRPFDPGNDRAEVIRGQYIAGDGQVGYREEPKVDPGSQVETYVAVRFHIDNWRWKGVPFYLRSGKRLCSLRSEIAVTFRKVPHSIFPAVRADDMTPVTLVLKVQPEEGMALTIQAKQPGPKFCMGDMTLNFNYAELAGGIALDAYARLLLDALLGDQTLFIRSDVTAASWELITPLLSAWQSQPERFPLYTYPAGTDGPEAAEKLLFKDGRQWRPLHQS